MVKNFTKRFRKQEINPLAKKILEQVNRNIEQKYNAAIKKMTAITENEQALIEVPVEEKQDTTLKKTSKKVKVEENNIEVKTDDNE
jgi:hypothetical protein